MRKNWLFISIYILLIAITTYIAGLYTEAQKAVEFLDKVESEVIENDLDLLTATMIANSGDKTEVRLYDEPLFESSFTSSLNQANVKIYAAHQKRNSFETYSLVILITDLKIVDDHLFLDENNYDYSEIHATIQFNQTVTVGSVSKKSFNETFVTMYDDSLKVIVINFNKLAAPNEIAIEMIQINYKLVDETEKLFIHLSSDELDQSSDQFDPSFNRHLDDINETKVKFDLEDSHVYYNSEMLKKFEYYNILYVRNIAIVLVIVLIITYFIFFHKYVYRTLKEKRKHKKELEREVIESYKQKEKEKE
ncbi:hypothetical protein [Acholeplasma hippikon]|uniref:Uncharacterized protein n=1 Tax=Acholeplasma hippikon TaxID=264636 RepID=A0A449BKQ6_9MOLU|nr:hypothetical protein [Acholeplasma hippikon]VEU83048.1 Uncharacterised protein [Acholeplasma hippikon]